MRAPKPLLAVAVAALALACGGKTTARPPLKALHVADLEDRLLRAERFTLRFDAVTTGPLEMTVSGNVAVAKDGVASFDVVGTMKGERFEAKLDSDGKTMKGNAWESPVPPALPEGIIIGFTRMGIMHNVVRLGLGGPPDGTDGKIRETVQLSDERYLTEEDVDGAPARRIAFKISMGGQPVGEATLWVDDRWLPLKREQVVHFPDGDLHVVERYRTIAVQEDL
jgi:hypothetical protein